MMWLPDVGPIAFGAFMAILIEVLKALGMPVRFADLANFIGAVVWAALVAAVGTWPGVEPWAVAVVQFIFALLSAWGVYKFALKPITHKRFNK